MSGWSVEPARVVRNAAIDDTMHHLTLRAPTIARAAAPGQFVAVRVPSAEVLLPRPFDLHFADPASGSVEVVFRVKGRGTRALAGVPDGAQLELHGPFGRPLDGTLEGMRRIAVVGRGAGISPLNYLAWRAQAAGVTVAAYLSARSPALLAPFERLWRVAEVVAQTDAEAPGELVTAALARDLERRPIDAAFVVGSRRLALETLALARARGFRALTFAESHMGCGFGHCKSCAVPTRNGYLLACTQGPVVDLEEVTDAYWHTLLA